MITLLLAAAGVLPVQATMPFVSPMFSDHMVLQREMRDPVWGWTDPGAKVTVTIDGKSSTVTAGSDGAWETTVGPLKVGGPYQLTIDGPQKASFTDILAGDVWICSGQSNMEFGLGNVINPSAEAAGADRPTVRLYAEPRLISPTPVKVNPSNWIVCTPQTVLSDGGWNGFSAVGYYFGAKLNDDLKVPIGLIHTSWGGTVAEAWTRSNELSRMPAFKGQLDQIAAYREMQKNGQMPTLAQQWVNWYQKNDAGVAGNWQAPTFDDSSWKTMTVPGLFQNAGIPELVNQMSVVWFRGSITVPASVASQDNMLTLQADDNDSVWVNGVLVGATDGYGVPRNYKVPAGTLKEGANSIVVRITDTSAPGGVYGNPDTFKLTATDGTITPLAGTYKVMLGAKVTGANAYPANFTDNPNMSTVLFNGMIAPIAPFGVKGAIWYQGESNAGRAKEYQTLLPTMISSWRNTFGEGSFPFLIVQLAGFGHPPVQPGNDGWAALREAQYLTTKNSPNTYMATAIDVGEENDIHPKDKRTVGERLAAVAENQVYHRRVIDSGPTYRSMKVVGSAVELTFDHAEDGLSIKGDVPLFAVAGADHVWHWAKAQIDGNKVTVSAPEVTMPVAVRYNWATFLAGSLYNGKGWPALPFRTDNW